MIKSKSLIPILKINMKTVRQNVFETNSSSSHSITIYNKNDPKRKAGKLPRPLEVDGVLYPDRLTDYRTSISDIEGAEYTYGTCDTTTCDTKDKKASLFVQGLYSESEDGYLDETLYNELLEILRKELGYSAIVFDPSRSEYQPSYGETSVAIDEDEGTYNEETFKEVIEQIKDDDIVMTYVYSSSE